MDKPTGPRPKPSIPKVKAAKGTGKMNSVKPAVKHTAMGAPKRAATMGNTSKRGRR